MEQISQIKSKIIHLNRDHLDNNEIMPSFFARKSSKKGSSQYLFNNLRYLPGLPKKFDPDFPLNKPENQGAKILLPGKYFAIEMEDEQAVWGLLDEGIKVLITNEMGHDFKLNSYRNGLLPIELTNEELDLLSKTGGQVLVDLPMQEIITADDRISFDVDQDYKEDLIHGKDRVSDTLHLYERQLNAYEKKWNTIY